MSKYYIIQKSGHRYDFNAVQSVRTEVIGKTFVKVVVSAQFLPRQRFKDIRLLLGTIKETNIEALQRMLNEKT